MNPAGGKRVDTVILCFYNCVNTKHVACYSNAPADGAVA